MSLQGRFRKPAQALRCFPAVWLLLLAVGLIIRSLAVLGQGLRIGIAQIPGSWALGTVLKPYSLKGAGFGSQAERVRRQISLFVATRSLLR